MPDLKFNIPTPTAKPELKKVEGQIGLRGFGYLVFITSVSAYAYATQYVWLRLLEASPYDKQLYVYVWALAICWVGSVLLMWKWFRFYQNYRPGFGSLILALLPALILPAAWVMLQGFEYLDVFYQ